MTHKEILERLSYDPKTGHIVWKNNVGRWGRIPAGSKATSLDSKGYLYVHFHDPVTKKSKNVRAHRLAWFMVYGVWPVNSIDHINGIRDDNRLCNLREATRNEQLQNTKVRSDNKCGVTGVSPTSHGTYAVAVWHKGKKHHVGTFSTIAEAAEAYLKKKNALHKFNSYITAPAGVTIHVKT